VGGAGLMIVLMTSSLVQCSVPTVHYRPGADREPSCLNGRGTWQYNQKLLKRKSALVTRRIAETRTVKTAKLHVKAYRWLKRERTVQSGIHKITFSRRQLA